MHKASRGAFFVSLMAFTFLLPLPPAAASPPEVCDIASPHEIAKTYDPRTPLRPHVLRCGTIKYGYRHIEKRWTADPRFDEYIQRTFLHGEREQQGNATVFDCRSSVQECDGLALRVVYENNILLDGDPQGIITAYHLD